MQPLDSEAAGALVLLEREAVEQDWSDGQRSAWSRFILAQMLRAPEDITLLISLVRQTFEADEKIQEMAQGANVTDAEMRAYVEQRRDTQPYELARMLMDHEGIGARFNKMHWRVLDVGSDIPLLTSDRPVWMTATISEDDALLWMPIGPRKLFTATVCLTTQRMLFAKSRREVAKNVNELVVRHAVNYVYGLSDSALVFVQKYFATRKHSSLLERLAAYRGLKTVAPDSDLAKT